MHLLRYWKLFFFLSNKNLRNIDGNWGFIEKFSNYLLDLTNCSSLTFINKILLDKLKILRDRPTSLNSTILKASILEGDLCEFFVVYENDLRKWYIQ